MIKKVLKSTMLLSLIAGSFNIASAQVKPTAVKPTAVSSSSNMSKKPPTENGQLFDKLDLDKNGKISKEESSKSNNERFIGSFDRMDTNKDGSVTREELKSARHYVNTTETKKSDKKMNPPLDANNDGKISHDEANKSGNQYYINNFQKMDTNKDGFISKEEKQSGKSTMKAEKTAMKKVDK